MAVGFQNSYTEMLKALGIDQEAFLTEQGGIGYRTVGGTPTATGGGRITPGTINPNTGTTTGSSGGGGTSSGGSNNTATTTGAFNNGNSTGGGQDPGSQDVGSMSIANAANAIGNLSASGLTSTSSIGMIGGMMADMDVQSMQEAMAGMTAAQQEAIAMSMTEAGLSAMGISVPPGHDEAAAQAAQAAAMSVQQDMAAGMSANTGGGEGVDDGFGGFGPTGANNNGGHDPGIGVATDSHGNIDGSPAAEAAADQDAQDVADAVDAGGDSGGGGGGSAADASDGTSGGDPDGAFAAGGPVQSYSHGGPVISRDLNPKFNPDGSPMEFAAGGQVDAPPPRGDADQANLEGTKDQIDAKLSKGEFVIPADVVAFFGEDFFEKQIIKARTKKQEATQAREGEKKALAEKKKSLGDGSALDKVGAAAPNAGASMSQLMGN